LGAMGKKIASAMGGSDLDRIQQSMDSGKFDMNDYKSMLLATNKLGGAAKVLKYVPGTKAWREKLEAVQDAVVGQSAELQSSLKMIDAMTPEERANPSILQDRAFKLRQRIVTEAGVELSDLNRLIEQFKITQGMMFKMYEFRKQKKPIPNDMESLMTMIRNSGGLSKEVNSILRRRQTK